MVTLRPAGADDIDEILTFWSEATSEPSSTDDADGIGALLDRAPGALVVAIDNGAIVGTVIAGWDGWRGALYRLAVAPAHRRRGIASALVNEAERHLRRARCAPHAPDRQHGGRPGRRSTSGSRRATSQPTSSAW